jgi:hypothetical protein
MKELEDYDWFPPVLRRQQLQYIGWLAQWQRLYQPMVAHLQELVKRQRPSVIQDVCSGSGRPFMAVMRELQNAPPGLLSDWHPDKQFVNTDKLQYISEPVNVLELTPHPGYCYTMFNAFHHFSAEMQSQLFQKMKATGSPFVVVEVLQPNLPAYLKVLLSATLIQVLTAPFVKPFSWLRLLFTWLLPVNIITVLYDGVISVMKSKTAVQYRRLLMPLCNEGYSITVTKLASLKVTLICITGEKQTK